MRPLLDELLTPLEQEIIEDAGKLWNKLCAAVKAGAPPSLDHWTSWAAGGDDMAELCGHIHAIQRAMMAQAAARAYPDLYRLLGSAGVGR